MSSYLKGLAATINGVEVMIDIDKIIPSPNNFFEIRDVEELAESIKDHGLMHNLVVRKLENGFYELISGERRLTALKYLNKSQARCIVCNVTELEAELMLIHGNTEQRELTPSEKMESIRRLKAIYDEKRAHGEELPKGKKTRDLIGEDMKMSGSQVGRYQKIAKGLIKPLVEKLNKDYITVTQAHTLSSLSKEEQQIIHEEIKDLDPKESKEEVDILIQGIKQPVENNMDKELLDDMYKPNNIETKEDDSDNESKLRAAFKEFVHPMLIISNSYTKGIIYIGQYSISDSILKVSDPYDKKCYLNIKISDFDKTNEIEIEDGKIINPKILYKISDGMYVWFKKKIGGIL